MTEPFYQKIILWCFDLIGGGIKKEINETVIKNPNNSKKTSQKNLSFSDVLFFSSENVGGWERFLVMNNAY